MKNKIFVISLVIVAIVFMNTGAIGADTKMQTGSSAACITPSEEDLKLALRTLWNEHIVWTRLAIMSLASGSADKDPVLNRLLKNSGDMANALKAFYGNQNGDKYGNLIKEHLVIAAGLVEAAKAGNTTAVNDADKKWHENADKIAAFENTLNPNLKLQDRKDMWNEHLNLTKAEAVAILPKTTPLASQRMT